MSFNICHIKSKLKRLVIEFHHNKNKLGKNTHIISQRDYSKPFLTLRRTGSETEEEHEVLDLHFDQFSDIAEEGEIPETVRYENNQSNLRDSQQQEKKEVSELLDVTHETLEQQLSEQQRQLEDSIRQNINYIEQEVRPRKRFWFFGKRIIPKFKSAQSTPSNASAQSLAENEESPVLTKIEIIAQSTSIDPEQGSEPSQKHQQYSHSALPQQIQQDTSRFGPGDNNSSFTLEGTAIGSADRASSFARKNLKHNTSSITLANSASKTERCSCVVCDRKSQKPVPEPWKIIMNDISLQAALLSTGSKVPVQSRSSLNLVADFTSSKHQESDGGHKAMCFDNYNNRVASDLINFEPVPDDLGQLSIANDENSVLETDLMEFSAKNGTVRSLVHALVKESAANTRPSTQGTKTSMISELLELDPFKAETSAVYDGVFQEYNYSDESISQKASTQPLSISSRGLKRIF